MLDGMSIGHWTDTKARTGCTVVLFPEGTVASGEVRGGAPGTREWDLLAPERRVARLDAFVMSGGSAYGLAACDGVMRWCAEQGRGFAVLNDVVPIVVGAVLFDLGVGNGKVRPDADAGYAACVAARGGARRIRLGRVGAGTGATVNKWRGAGHVQPGGLGMAEIRSGSVVVGALIAVNAWGEITHDDGHLPAEEAASILDSTGFGKAKTPGETPSEIIANTTIGLVYTNAPLDKVGCLLVAQGAHDGLARALWPVHTTVDGDAIVAASVGQPTATRADLGGVPIDLVRMLAVEATARAIRSVRSVGPAARASVTGPPPKPTRRR